MDQDAYFTEYGQPPHTSNNLTPDPNWPLDGHGAHPFNAPQSTTSRTTGADAVSATGSRSTHFLLPDSEGRGPRSYITSAHQINARQRKTRNLWSVSFQM